MNIGVIGRHPAILERALALIGSHGHSARGTLIDAEALAWVRSRAVQCLLIGGGVDDPSRKALLDACTNHQVRAVEVFGPHNLERVVAEL